jgi:SAM-dependent methyltransferase
MDPTYGAVARAFDRTAPVYDDLYGTAANPLMAWLRAESLGMLRRLLPAGGRVLELGCGTGEETLALARAGYWVLALDISPGMVRRARQKARAAGLDGRVEFLAMPAGALAALRPRPAFEGAYAGFGALNCEPDLRGLGAALGELLIPGASFVASVINRRCLFETLWLVGRGFLHQVGRGRGLGWGLTTLPAAGGRATVPVRPLSAEEVAAAFRPAFRLEAWLALPLLLPPAYMAAVYRRHAGLFERLLGAERFLRGRWPWRDWGDHTLVILRRR